MKLSEMRGQMEKQLQDRRKESASTNEGGMKFGTIIRPDVEVPEWRCKEGDHLIDILPYLVGKNNPEKVKEGSVGDHVTYYVHKNVGAGDAMFVCPLVNFGNPCPICEHKKQLKEDGADDTVWGALKAKRVTLYNIIVYDTTKDEEKGVQLWNVAHWNMERHLNALAQKPRGGGRVAYAHPDTGKSIAFKRQGSGPDNTQYIGHKFEDREYTIPEELLDSTFCLEDLVHIPTYEEIASAYFGHKQAPAVEVDEAPIERKPRPTLSRPVKKEKPECFGIHTDDLEECGSCNDYWDLCVAEREMRHATADTETDPEPEEIQPPPKPSKPSLRQRMNR